MKKYLIKMVALMLFTSIAISGCSLEYRQRHMHRNDPNGHDRHGRDNNRDRYHDGRDNYHRY